VSLNSRLWNAPRLFLNSVVRDRHNTPDILRVAIAATRLLGGLFHRPMTAGPFYRMAPLQRIQGQKLKVPAPPVHAINWNRPTTASRGQSIATHPSFRELYRISPILEAFAIGQAAAPLSTIRTQAEKTVSFHTDLSRLRWTQPIIATLHSGEATAKKRDTAPPLLPATKIPRDLPDRPVAPLASSSGRVSPGKTITTRVAHLPFNLLSAIHNADVAPSTPDKVSSSSDNFTVSKDQLPLSDPANDTAQQARRSDGADSAGLKSDTGAIILDGAALAQWVVNYLETALTRPQSGMTGVDPRAAQPMSRLTPF
jgi:hypothetical protein